MKNTRRISLFGLIFFLTFLGVSCVRNDGNVKLTSHPITATNSGFLTFTSRKTYTFEPIITSTPKPINSPTVSIKPSITPLPTLSGANREALITELLESNGMCSYPCWWGLTPGESSWITTNQFLNTFVDEIDEFEQVIDGKRTINVRYQVPDNLYSYLVTFWVDLLEDKILSINSKDTQDEEKFQLPKLLSNHGKPSEIIVHVIPFKLEPLQEGYPFELLLYYPDQYMIAHYEIRAEKTGKIIYFCNPEPRDGSLYLWSPEVEVDFEQYAFNSYNFFGSLLDETKPIQYIDEVTNMNVDNFYETFVNPQNSKCLESSEDEWLVPLE